jgi:hypothetical protein
MAKVMTAFRIHPDDLAEIDRRAHRLHMTRTEYLTRAGLDDLPIGLSDRERIAALEQDVAKLHELAFN